MKKTEEQKAASAAKRTVFVGILSGVAIFAYGLWISRSHITHIGYWLGLSPLEAETLFVFIDFLALYGKLLTSRRLKAKTRRYGFRVMLAGFVLSTACNIGSGLLLGSLGVAGYGVLIVAIIIAVEYGVSITEAAKSESTESPVEAIEQLEDVAPVSPAVVAEKAAGGARGDYGPRNGVEYADRTKRRKVNGK